MGEVTQQDKWVATFLGIELGEGGEAEALEKVAARIGKSIDTEVANAVKPIALKERIGYCTSELDGLDKGIAKLGGGVRKTKLGQASEALKKKLEKAKTDGIRQAKDMLTAVGQSFQDAADKLTLQVDRIGADKKKLYKEMSALAVEVTREHRDWNAQVKEGRDYLGKEATALEIGVGKLATIAGELDAAILKCLPKLTSKIGTKPDNVPGGVGGKMVDDPATAMTECGNDWVKAKQTFGANKKEMQKLADYRKTFVDKWLNDNLNPWGMSVGPGKGWVSVGSDDPTSDYDISINKHGRKEGVAKPYYDHEIVKAFNAYFRQTFGIESGTIFDTNLYASAPAEVPKLDEDASEAEKDAVAEVDASADVGALMKQRRYMSSADFEDYRVRTVASVRDPKKKKALEAQFRAADANYMISLFDIVNKIREQLATEPPEGKLSDEQTEEREEAKKLIEAFDNKTGDAEGLGIATGEEALEHLARELEHLKDVMTSATNDLYADATGACRTQEGKINEFKGNLDKVKQAIGDAKKATTPDLPKLAEQLEGLGVQMKAVQLIKEGKLDEALTQVDGQLATMLSDLARQTALSMFHANEAYQSGGPFRHVVWAGQAVETDVKAEVNKDDPEAWGKLSETEQKKKIKEERDKRRAELSQEESLQSFNEQLGDFLKDLAHYGDADPGVAIIQSSKYLERLVDAVGLMVEKTMFDSDTALKSDLEKQLALQGRLKDELIAARKGNLWMEPQGGSGEVDQVAQRRAYACDFMAKLGINSVAALGKTYSELGIRVNTAARKAISG